MLLAIPPRNSACFYELCHRLGKVSHSNLDHASGRGTGRTWRSWASSCGQCETCWGRKPRLAVLLMRGPMSADNRRPLWRSPFVSRLAPEDRWHLNGVALEDGRPLCHVDRRPRRGRWLARPPRRWRSVDGCRNQRGAVARTLHAAFAAHGRRARLAAQFRDGRTWVLRRRRQDIRTGRVLSRLCARAKCRAVAGSTAAGIAPSHTCRCQSSGRRIVMRFVMAKTPRRLGGFFSQAQGRGRPPRRRWPATELGRQIICSETTGRDRLITSPYHASWPTTKRANPQGSGGSRA